MDKAGRHLLPSSLCGPPASIVNEQRFGVTSTVPCLIRQLFSTMVLQAAYTVDTVQAISLTLFRALMKRRSRCTILVRYFELNQVGHDHFGIGL